MGPVKLAIVYYSATGINYQLAQWQPRPPKKPEPMSGSSASLRPHRMRQSIPIQPGGPTSTKLPISRKPAPTTSTGPMPSSSLFRLVSAAWRPRLKNFIDLQGGLWAQGKLMDKTVSAMSSAQNPHGGQEATILSLYTSMFHWGAIVVAPGFTDDSIFKAGGNPYGTSVSQGADGKPVEDVQGAVAHQTKRLIAVTARLKAGAGA